MIVDQRTALEAADEFLTWHFENHPSKTYASKCIVRWFDKSDAGSSLHICSGANVPGADGPACIAAAGQTKPRVKLLAFQRL
jgi:hypothetical protein